MDYMAFHGDVKTINNRDHGGVNVGKWSMGNGLLPRFITGHRVRPPFTMAKLT